MIPQPASAPRSTFRWMPLAFGAVIFGLMPACTTFTDTSFNTPDGLSDGGGVDEGFVDDGIGADDQGNGPDVGDVVTPGENACGGNDPLIYQGTASSPGEPCGDCEEGSFLYCTGPNTLSCFDVRNAAGGCGPLPNELGNPCGPCGEGRWEPIGGELVCTSPGELNACGGCGELEGVGATGLDGICSFDGEDGKYQCISGTTVACVTTGMNACATTDELSIVLERANADVPGFEPEPGNPCGTCGAGRWTCRTQGGSTELYCREPLPGELGFVNECGGCNGEYERYLRDRPDVCPCGGQRACFGTGTDRGRVRVCQNREDNFIDYDACGTCTNDGSVIAVGGECAGGAGVESCVLTDGPVCVASGSNACGGPDPLEGDPPGSRCGACDSGITRCISLHQTACFNADEENPCGGCGLLPFQPGDPCGPNHTWTCETGVDMDNNLSVNGIYCAVNE